MFFSFQVADPYSGLQYRLNDVRLAELSLAPIPPEWNPGSVIMETPDPTWANSLANAPAETVVAVSTALNDLIVATSDLKLPQINELDESRAKRHLAALTGLWRRMGGALPDGLAVVRHVLELPFGEFLAPLPVVEGSLDPLAPRVMMALYDRLRTEFGEVSPSKRREAAPAGSRLRALQNGLSSPDLRSAPADDTLSVYGLRDPAACADFTAARARTLIEAGCPAREIAVMVDGDPRQVARAFREQGVPISGLPECLPERDVPGEMVLHLLLAKRSPTPAMVLAALALSPLMPWSAQTGRELAEKLIQGDFRSQLLEADPDHVTLWNDIRASAGSRAQLRFLLERICDRLPQGKIIRARLAPLQHLLTGDGAPDWEVILRSVQIASPEAGASSYNLEGVSLWSPRESPWRPCRHLIIVDFTEGLYPVRPRANPMFLDSEIIRIREKTGLRMRNRAESLSHSLDLFTEQLQASNGSVTFLVPYRDLAGVRHAPSAGLSLVARAVEGVADAADLIIDLSRVAPQDWPVIFHEIPSVPDLRVLPDALDFSGYDLLALRRDDDGAAKPQSPSRLETLIVSPLAWLLNELGATDLSWSADTLDVLTMGNIAHDVFEHVFLPNVAPPEDEALAAAVADAYERALTRHASYLRSASWEMERRGLERDILSAARRWCDHLHALGAKIIGNELWLEGEAHGVRLHGKADVILELPDGTLLVVDHKKSSTRRRRNRMNAGWDLQTGLYRDMIARPVRREGDSMELLTGRPVGIAYHLMNDGGLLSSGVAMVKGTLAQDMGDEVNVAAVAQLTTRLAELGVGRIVLNTTDDFSFFEKKGGFTPYALADGSPLVHAFMREVEQ
ncbi:PD-(D/E)XK nuclease family protein [Acetobacter fallax]|uniref:PD-(D/E)XK nuclease family protein n=1 Tax=Acetobacter fallax TaxID=1737473 RepID=A0ABX0KD12_9PROT|nr:PD-(D/E)XK nuclease family protein [Acetobacter fallax]NHO34300.1 PD-(D/E)XK nuclease family protein [Acetobacter fallax]NHO37862.1 PD-(D/E)XK nuclease family protein [Acetobacter fallax]